MIETALKGSKLYYGWMATLAVFSAMGAGVWLFQFNSGLGITGMCRDVPWALYIAQLTFMVGIAAGAVMVVLPYYVHDYKAFGSITILGEFLAIPSVIIAMLFVIIDMGRPDRVFFLMLHPTPNSPIFWDILALSGYLCLNIVISYVTFRSKVHGSSPPSWLKPIIYLSIPLAISIHTITAFIYCGLAARPFWLSAVLAPRFLTSAFACGPGLLIIIILILRKLTCFDIDNKAIDKLTQIVTYSLIINIFLLGLEFFTVFYSNIPFHKHPFQYLYFGIDGYNRLMPLAWVSLFFSITAAFLLIIPAIRKNTAWLAVSLVMMILGLWIDKGVNMIITGFVPNAMNQIVEYMPSIYEIILILGIYSGGAMMFTILCKLYLFRFEEISQ
jgi:[DsrC]-trisulfide reductase subunit P